MISAALAVLQTDEQRKDLTDFYEKNKNRLYSIAFSKLHNREDAEDAVQETFLRIANKPERFFQISQNKRTAFADVIIRNIAVDMYRKNSAIEEVELTDIISAANLEPDFQENIFAMLSSDELIRCISELSPLQRDILELNVYQGLTIREMSQFLSISENVVRQRLYRARKSLRLYLENKESNNV